jgi:hypothetical protein
MQYIPLVIVLLGAAVCFSIFVAGTVLMLRMGGWQAMMQPTAAGHWSLPRRMIYGGAMGGVAFQFLFYILRWIPGAVPWM